MRVLLSTYGGRGDVEPLVGLQDSLHRPGVHANDLGASTTV